MQYRSEIDGLRAIAVVPVLLFHAGFSLFSGGFVGVDVFFVISGYLISSLIYQEAAAGKFSILNFYERRVRRIIPALIAVIIPSMIIAPFVMLPDDYENFAQSVIATLLFGNNLLLAVTAGYWDLAAEFKPLLHTWSLGLEEQFYILYPLGLMLVLKIRQSLFPLFLLFGIGVSIAANLFLTPQKPEAFFYFLHFRAWELLLGAFCGYAERWQRDSKGSDLLAGAGLVMILLSVVLLPAELANPSAQAALPCIGTALILSFARQGTLVARLLSTGPFIGIGLISYSAYLWHQPLFAFARILSFEEPPLWLFSLLILVTMGLAYLSWRFVEQPFRDRSRFTRGQIFGLATLASVALIVPSYVIYKNVGFPDRVASMNISHTPPYQYNMRAFAYKKPTFDDPTKPNLLLLGNSHARDFLYVMLETDQFDGYELLYDNRVKLCAGFENQPRAHLIDDADAFVIIPGAAFTPDCGMDLDHPQLRGKPLVVIGPTHFGFNLNAYMRVPEEKRPLLNARLMPDLIEKNATYKAYVPAQHYLDVLGIFKARYNGLPIFDAQGGLVSPDRLHLTHVGTRLFAETVLDDPVWDAFALEATD
mgnify:CR=1 FL=1